MNTNKQTHAKDASAQKQRNYQEVIEYLDAHDRKDYSFQSMERMQKLDALFSNPSQKINAITITGTNGKSLTAHFTAKLFAKENISVGVFFTPHILTYNERFVINSESIANKTFTDSANEVIQAVTAAGINATTTEILTQMAFNYFYQEKVDVVLLESSHYGPFEPTLIAHSKIVAITRLNGTHADEKGNVLEPLIHEYLAPVRKGVYVISADQNKNNLKHMELFSEQKEALWAMPIRKLAPLDYPFEQLHGRCAALAERIAFIYVNNFVNKEGEILSESILAKQKGQRGRPTLEQKRLQYLNPKHTIGDFWKETTNELVAHFQLLDKEKPSILLDNASNSDALENTLLGVRLLHYQRPIKGLVLIVAAHKDSFDMLEFSKQIRYFFKKMNGSLIICPTHKVQGKESWDMAGYQEVFKDLKVKIKTTDSFKEAFDAAKKIATDRSSLVVITGSTDIIKDYFDYKGIKKF